jgi:hypothetical protein
MGSDHKWSKSDRRAFLQQCGRFAVVTPPVVTLMLSVGDKAIAGNLATSGATTKTRTTKTETTSCKTSTSLMVSCSVETTGTATTVTYPTSVCKTSTSITIVCPVRG